MIPFIWGVLAGFVFAGVVIGWYCWRLDDSAFQLVPREATPGMIEAMCEIDCTNSKQPCFGDCRCGPYKYQWRAALLRARMEAEFPRE